jgi:hypothetical protein
VPPQDVVHRLRDADREALHAACEPRRRVRFHDQMEMVGLNAELKKPEPIARGNGQGVAHDCEDALAPQRGQSRGRSQGDVSGTSRLMGEAGSMGNRAPAECGLASGAQALAAPRADRELQLLGAPPHLDWAVIITS